MWLVDPLARPKDPSDMIVFARAEDVFDLSGRLAEIVAPTLVLGGDRDEAYGSQIFTRTARGVRDGRLILYSGRTHSTTLTHPSCAPEVAAFLGVSGFNKFTQAEVEMFREFTRLMFS